MAAYDEIGHFQYCASVSEEGGDCLDPTADDDDEGCFSAAFSLLVPIGGCLSSNTHFDGTSYLPDWPGTNPNRPRYSPWAGTAHPSRTFSAAAF